MEYMADDEESRMATTMAIIIALALAAVGALGWGTYRFWLAYLG